MLCSLLSRRANSLEASNRQSRDSKHWCLLHALPRLRSKRDACRKAITIFSSNNSTAIGKKSGTHFYLHPTVPKGTGEKAGWRQAGTPVHGGEGRLQAGRKQAGSCPQPLLLPTQAACRPSPRKPGAGSFGFKPAPASLWLK